MSGATIDITKRARIRSLAARMHRARIANVFSIDGGAHSVDESALTAEQCSEAAKILEEAADTIDDVATAARVAAMVSRYVKPSCSTCHGNGIVRRGSIDDLCVCVDRRWQAAVDHQAFVDSLRGANYAFGARTEGTRVPDREVRAAAAREVLARARAEAQAACADLDARIVALEIDGAVHSEARGRLDESRVAAKSRAEDQERLAATSAATAEEAQNRVEEIALQIARSIEPVFEARSAGAVEDRALTHEAVDAFYDAASAAGRHRSDQKIAEEAARVARAEEKTCEQRIAALDVDSAPILDKIEKLRVERTRIAKHHQPKIDRAEKRLRRLVYLSGGSGSADTAAGVAEDAK